MAAKSGEGVEELFQRAADHMRTNTTLRLTNEQKLQLYGFYKQATEGKCHTPKPSFFDFTAKAKWESWNRLSEMGGTESMELYIKLVNDIDPNWQTSPLGEPQERRSEDTGTAAGTSAGGSGTGGPVVSTLAIEDEVIPDNEKNMFDWCKEGHLDQLKSCLADNEDINHKDSEGMSLLHWACDRGNTDVIAFLIANGADLELQDSDGQTPLHYASFCGHKDAIELLLSKGADRTKKDNNGETPIDVSDQSVQSILHQ